MNRKEELEFKIKKLKEKLNIGENSCAGLQKEEFESYSQDRMYLEVLEKELEKIDFKN